VRPRLAAAGVSGPFALYSAGAAFVVLPQEEDNASLRDGVKRLATSWHSDLTLWNGR